MDYTREEAAQLARLRRAMNAPADSSPTLDDSIDAPNGSEFFEFMADMAPAGRIVLIWLLVVIACGLAAYLIAAGIDAIEPHWAVAVAMLGV